MQVLYLLYFQEGVLRAGWVSGLQTLKRSPTGSTAPPPFLKEHADKLLYEPQATSETDFFTEKWK